MTGVDKKLVRERFRASADSYEASAVAQKEVHQQLLKLLKGLGRTSFPRVLEVGCGTAGLTKLLDENFEVGEWTLNDLGREPFEKGDFFRKSHGKLIHFMEGDAEELELGSNYDLFVSASAIQWFHNPQAFIQKLYPMLNEGGILLISSFGKENLHELLQLTGRGLDYYNEDSYKSFLEEAGFEVLCHVTEKIILNFDTPRDVLKHLKETGVTALSKADESPFWTKGKLEQFEIDYRTKFSTAEGKVSLTYQPIYLLCQKIVVR